MEGRLTGWKRLAMNNTRGDSAARKFVKAGGSTEGFDATEFLQLGMG